MRRDKQNCLLRIDQYIMDGSKIYKIRLKYAVYCLGFGMLQPQGGTLNFSRYIGWSPASSLYPKIPGLKGYPQLTTIKYVPICMYELDIDTRTGKKNSGP